jgi:hypothetical protein
VVVEADRGTQPYHEERAWNEARRLSEETGVDHIARWSGRGWYVDPIQILRRPHPGEELERPDEL